MQLISTLSLKEKFEFSLKKVRILISNTKFLNELSHKICKFQSWLIHAQIQKRYKKCKRWILIILLQSSSYSWRASIAREAANIFSNQFRFPNNIRWQRKLFKEKEEIKTFLTRIFPLPKVRTPIDQLFRAGEREFFENRLNNYICSWNAPELLLRLSGNSEKQILMRFQSALLPLEKKLIKLSANKVFSPSFQSNHLVFSSSVFPELLVCCLSSNKFGGENYAAKANI